MKRARRGKGVDRHTGAVKTGARRPAHRAGAANAHRAPGTSSRYTRAAVPANRLAFSSSPQPAAIRLNAFHSAT